MQKAVFFDIDGTLINIVDGQLHLSAYTRKAIKHLREKGIFTFVSSGRPLAFLSEEMKDPSLFDGFVLMNGALVMLKTEIVSARPLPPSVVEAAIALCKKEPVEYILEGEKQAYLPRDFPLMEQFFTQIGVCVDGFCRDLDFTENPIYKMEFLSRQRGGNRVYTKLLDLPGMTGLMDPFHCKNLELYSSQVSKATGILDVLSYLHIPRENSYAFGDGRNDIEMLKTVGNGFAMDNGCEEAKQSAIHIVPSVDDDGVAWGIDHLILGKGRRD